jgi:hypothetical protein
MKKRSTKNRLQSTQNRMKNQISLNTLSASALLCVGLALTTANRAEAATFVTIQPHTSGNGYVVTYSWKGTFAAGMDSSSNGSNAYLDNNTTTVSSDYVMASGNNSGGKIRYSQHNNNGINGDFAFVPASGANPVHWDGSNGESLTVGAGSTYMRESSHSNIDFTETTSGSPDWYNNPNDFGGIRFFGTGVQGAESLTSWNGIDSSAIYGNEQFEGSNLLGQGMQFGVNGSTVGLAETARFGMIGDAMYWNDLGTAGNNNGLLIGYFPYATTFPNATPDPDKFIDQFHVGTYASGDTTMTIVNDSSFVPLLVAIPEPSSALLLSLGGLALLRRRRQ